MRPTSLVAGNALDLDLSGWDLPDGVYSLVVTGPARAPGIVYSALPGRPSKSGLRIENFAGNNSLGYSSDSRLWPFSASTTENNNKSPTKVVIRGSVIYRGQNLPAAEGTPPLLLDSVSKHLDEDPIVPTEKLNRTILGVANCFTGAHHWLYDTVRDLADYYRPIKESALIAGKGM